jgi:hypothetical protein
MVVVRGQEGMLKRLFLAIWISHTATFNLQCDAVILQTRVEVAPLFYISVLEYEQCPESVHTEDVF